MSNDKTKTACELTAILATEPDGGHRGAHLIAQDALRLIALGRCAHNLAVRRCNGEGQQVGKWDDADESRANTVEERILREASGIAAQYQAKAKLGGDPRGYVLKLQFKSGRNNTWGNDGWGV